MNEYRVTTIKNIAYYLVANNIANALDNFINNTAKVDNIPVNAIKKIELIKENKKYDSTNNNLS